MHSDEEEIKHAMTRRRFLQAATVAASGVAGLGTAACRGAGVAARDYNPFAAHARVTILHAASYSKNLSDLLRQGMKNHSLNVQGKRVVLKPNLVEYHTAHKINTNPLLVAAAIDCFKGLGAREVTVADGPGHQRDTEMLLEVSGLGEIVRSERVKFVDLNTDSIHLVRTASQLTTLQQLWLPETILNADLVVSMPKMKTHHWAGVTLSLKNLFGVIPSVRYGWPKNVLHWHGIDESIVDIATTVRPGFTIIDGIEGMEGNGPLHGETVSSQVIVMSENLAAADATAARLMSIDPLKVKHLGYMRNLGEPLAERRITQTGERLGDYRREFRLIESFSNIRMKS
jgi:uncharacterized protein (DUF362 family)